MRFIVQIPNFTWMESWWCIADFYLICYTPIMIGAYLFESSCAARAYIISIDARLTKEWCFSLTSFICCSTMKCRDELGRFVADKRNLKSLKMEGCSNLGGFVLCSSSLSTLWLSDLHSLSKMVIVTFLCCFFNVMWLILTIDIDYTHTLRLHLEWIIVANHCFEIVGI
jgi:hypothetical protein